jgi:hypothetical protein
MPALPLVERDHWPNIAAGQTSLLVNHDHRSNTTAGQTRPLVKNMPCPAGGGGLVNFDQPDRTGYSWFNAAVGSVEPGNGWSACRILLVKP